MSGKKWRPTVAQRLRDRLEDELGISLQSNPQRIWGEPSGSCRWFAVGDDGVEYLSYDRMADCVKASCLDMQTPPSSPNQRFIECREGEHGRP